MELTPEQTDALPFPKGCPVWYNFPDKSSSDMEVDEVSSILLKQGVVQSVSFNILTKDLMYKIVYKDEKDIIEEVTQDKLAYAAGCQVIISSDKDDGSDIEGTVLLCEPSPTGLIYTIQTSVEGFQANYEAGVDAKLVKYRKVTTTDDKKADGVAAEKDAAAKSVPVVPLSITCDSNNSKDGTTLSASTTPTAKRASQPQHTNTRTTGVSNGGQDSRKSITNIPSTSLSNTTNHPLVVLTIPLWLQKDFKSQRNLFFHLIRRGVTGRGVTDIGRETACVIRVQYDPKLREQQPPITISIVANFTRTAQSDILTARTKIEDLIIDGNADYSLARDAAKERLLYEMAICHNGPHVGSTSRAVETRDIFGGMSFITIIDIPAEVHEERFMYSHLFNSFITDRIQYLQCCIKLCGDGNEYDLKTHFCDPFVLVMGRKWQSVDEAASIVKNAMGVHIESKRR